MRDYTGVSPSFIVRLKSPELAKQVLNARRSYNINYFSTKDIDCSILSSEVASSLPECTIFINEVLSTSDQLNNLSLKETAKWLGFKYEGYRSGRILVQ